MLDTAGLQLYFVEKRWLFAVLYRCALLACQLMAFGKFGALGRSVAVPVEQESKSGPVTVWVLSTRVAIVREIGTKRNHATPTRVQVGCQLSL